MSYTRVLVIENPLGWAAGIKIFRKSAQPALNALQKAKRISKLVAYSGWRTQRSVDYYHYFVVRTSDHVGARK